MTIYQTEYVKEKEAAEEFFRNKKEAIRVKIKEPMEELMAIYNEGGVNDKLRIRAILDKEMGY
jgi:hypothetical protein